MTKRHLRLRGDTWYFNYAVPKHLQPILKKKNITKSLGTDSLKTARMLRDNLLREYEGLSESHGVNPEGVRLRTLISEIREKYSKASEEEHYWALDDIYDAERVSKTDPLLADAILIANKGNDSSSLSGVSVEYTLGEVCAEYINKVKDQRSQQTINTTKRALKYFEQFRKSRNILLKSIDRPSVTRFIDFLRNDVKVGSKSTSNMLSCLNKIYKYARDYGYVENESPFQDHSIIKSVGDDTKGYRPFTLEQFTKLMSIINNSRKISEARKWFVPMMLMTGMRPSELAGLYKDDIFEEEGLWFISVHETKERRLKTKNSYRKIPIHSSVLNIFLKLKNDKSNESKFLFNEVKDLESPLNSTGQWFSRLKRKHITEDSDVALYSLRAMFATACENAGIEERATAYLMGHSRIAQGLAYGLYSTGLEPSLSAKYIDKVGEKLTPYVKCFPSL
ncbi:site-specific integrase [Pseudoalteromonas sp. T1lg88]|uniref:site-specific integrase n=1 Tax=Pseudoalteromonas sp. T1lg88 TaxID=2077104 RepID=UPI000CF61628|nr:site-specific integrase [Pseudoalteromonas sp. T1lg88]